MPPWTEAAQPACDTTLAANGSCPSPHLPTPSTIGVTVATRSTELAGRARMHCRRGARLFRHEGSHHGEDDLPAAQRAEQEACERSRSLNHAQPWLSARSGSLYRLRVLEPGRAHVVVVRHHRTDGLVREAGRRERVGTT